MRLSILANMGPLFALDRPAEAVCADLRWAQRDFELKHNTVGKGDRHVAPIWAATSLVVKTAVRAKWKLMAAGQPYHFSGSESFDSESTRNPTGNPTRVLVARTGVFCDVVPVDSRFRM
ncbi:MAG: hypothetical protein ACI9BH_002348 [Paracoccaceae bacterium]|jgi:hypothetical protein